MIPQIAAAVVVRFHQMPMTSAGKLPAMASENAQPTIARMSEGRVEAVAAAAIATNSSSTRATIKRRATSVDLGQNMPTISSTIPNPPSSSQRHAIPATGLAPGSKK